MGLQEAETMLPRVLFELSENVVMSPVVWARLPEFVQQALVERHKYCIVDSTTMPSPENFKLSPSIDRYLTLSVRDFYEVREE